MGHGKLFSEADTFPAQLSGEQRDIGQRRFRQFLLLNGISVALLMENMLILYAIRNGASDPVVAVLASFIHLTMPAMIIGKRWVSRFGLSRTMALGWFLRYASAMLMLLAPPLAALGLPELGVATIMVGAFGFAFFRSIGAVANTPLTGEITTAEERGSFISGNTARVQSTYIVTMALVVLALRLSDALWVYQVIIGVGCTVGFYASTVLAGVPESIEPQRSARVSLVTVVRELFATTRLRRLFLGWCAGFVSFAAVIPFAMITVKNGYGLSDYQALFFSLVLVVGAISSALVNGLIADRVGPRPLVIIYVAGLIAVAGFWALAPQTFYPVVVGAAFFVAGVCKTGIITGLGHYFLSAASQSQRVGSALVMRVGSGAAAGVTGSVIGALLLDLLRGGGLEGLAVYHGYFRIMLVPLALFLLAVIRLERLSEWRISNILGLMFSPRDLRALFVLNRLKRRSDETEAASDLRALERIGAQVSEEEIRAQLYSPRLAVRLRAIRALRNIAFGKETTAALIDQLVLGEFTTAAVAAEILGASGCGEAIPALRESLHSEDHLLQSRSIAALAELGDTESLGFIATLFERTDNPRVAIHAANALAHVGGSENLSRILRRSVEDSIPPGVRDELLTAAASMVGAETHLYRFLRHYNLSRERGVAEALSEINSAFDEPTVSQITSESAEDPGKLRHFSRALVEIARRLESDNGLAMRRFLEDHQPETLSRRLAFGLAIMLSVMQESEKRHDEDSSTVLGPTAP